MQGRAASKVVFLPIKPVYAERLIDGSKLFEFRRRPIASTVSHIVVYASSPRKQILGIVEVCSIRSGSVRTVWNETREFAGISRTDFFSYFAGTDTAYAIAIDPTKTIKLNKTVTPWDIEPDFVVPQSFKYIDSQFVSSLMNAVAPC